MLGGGSLCQSEVVNEAFEALAGDSETIDGSKIEIELKVMCSET